MEASIELDCSHSSVDTPVTLKSRPALSDITNGPPSPSFGEGGGEGKSPFLKSDVSPIQAGREEREVDDNSCTATPPHPSRSSPTSDALNLRLRSLSTPIRNLPQYIRELQKAVARSNHTVSMLNDNLRQVLRQRDTLEKKNTFLERSLQRARLRGNKGIVKKTSHTSSASAEVKPIARTPRRSPSSSPSSLPRGRGKALLRVTAAVRGEMDDVKDELRQVPELMADVEKAIMRKLEEVGVEEKNRRIAQLERRVAELEAEARREGEEKEELQKKYLVQSRERKKLLNTVQNLRGNIRVFCRIRPSLEDGAPDAILRTTPAVDEEEGATEVQLLGDAVSTQRQSLFEFDRVFAEHASQEQVYDSVSSLVQSAMDGYNVCIFAYGQTGSGKTYTMAGTATQPGVNVRALDTLFSRAQDAEEYDMNVWMSMCEVYNESIRDLLDERVDKKLEVKMAGDLPGFAGNVLQGVDIRPVASIEDVNEVIEEGTRNRHVGATKLNVESSRSHLILSVYMTRTNVSTGDTTSSKLQLIDLAGSERLKRTGAEGERLKEAQNINRSLSALGDVVNALVSKSSHIPYRNSKLTHLLQDSLSGQSKVLMMMCVSGQKSDASESIASLNFAVRARAAELGKAKRQPSSSASSSLSSSSIVSTRTVTPESSSSSVSSASSKVGKSDIPTKRRVSAPLTASTLASSKTGIPSFSKRK